MNRLSEIFIQHGTAYLNKYSKNILPSHRKAVKDIIQCRTPVLGGIVYHCEECNEYKYSYHSCGNRNCPKCQNDKADEWLSGNLKLLLPVNYFMITFTLNGALRKLARSNQNLFYKLLFKSSSNSIEKLSEDNKYIGGKPGFMGVLHTWARDLSYHPHIHCVVTGGGLSDNKWRKSKNNFMLPVKALSIIFKAKFRDELKKVNPDIFYSIPSKIWKENWVVNSIPVGSGEHALKYLSQYIFRVAISNSRIVNLKNGNVTFIYKESKSNTRKTKTLSADKFISAFLQHVLPKGFVKVRYYGLYAAKNRNTLSMVRDLLGAYLSGSEVKSQIKKTKIFCCSKCGKEMNIILMLKRDWMNKAPPLSDAFIFFLNQLNAKNIF